MIEKVMVWTLLAQCRYTVHCSRLIVTVVLTSCSIWSQYRENIRFFQNIFHKNFRLSSPQYTPDDRVWDNRKFFVFQSSSPIFIHTISRVRHATLSRAKASCFFHVGMRIRKVSWKFVWTIGVNIEHRRRAQLSTRLVTNKQSLVLVSVFSSSLSADDCPFTVINFNYLHSAHFNSMFARSVQIYF